jgi:phosphatidylserine decarboxylase
VRGPRGSNGCVKERAPVAKRVPRFARGAAPWILAPAALALLLGATAWSLSGLAATLLLAAAGLALLAFLFFLQFFRDPERAVAEGIASPADGRVVAIDQVDDPDVGPADRLAIFMSPADVHVNRSPVAGTVVAVTRRPGGYLPAFRKESERNERVETLLEAPGFGTVKVVQIAGTVARRIVPYLGAGAVVEKGDRIGLIRLGSRCDLLFPVGRVRWSVALGARVHGALTQVGEPVAAPAGPRGARPGKRAAPARKAKRAAGAKRR